MPVGVMETRARSQPPPTACTLLDPAVFILEDWCFSSCLMVPTGLLFLSWSDRRMQYEAFILGTPGYLCRLCCLKGHVCSLYDNRLLLLSSSKATIYYTANFVLCQHLPPSLCVEQSMVIALLFLIFLFSLLLLCYIGGGPDSCL